MDSFNISILVFRSAFVFDSSVFKSRYRFARISRNTNIATGNPNKKIASGVIEIPIVPRMINMTKTTKTAMAIHPDLAIFPLFMIIPHYQQNDHKDASEKK